MLGRPGAGGPRVGPRGPRLTMAGTVMLWFHCGLAVFSRILLQSWKTQRWVEL